MRGASVDCDIHSNTVLPVRFASSTYGRKTGNTAASSHRDSISWRTPALEFLHIVWTKREMAHREKLVWMAKQKRLGAVESASKRPVYRAQWKFWAHWKFWKFL
jgi:hypothetical protein